MNINSNANATMFKGSIPRCLLGTGIGIGELDGKETLATARDIFPGGIDPELEFYNQPGKPTPKTIVMSYQIGDDECFLGVCRKLGKLETLRLSQAQIKNFCRNSIVGDFLRDEEAGVISLFTKGDEPAKEDGTNVLLAYVVDVGDGLEVFFFDFHEFSDICEDFCLDYLIFPLLPE